MKIPLRKADQIFLGVVNTLFIDVELHADMINFDSVIFQTVLPFLNMKNEFILKFIKQ